MLFIAEAVTLAHVARAHALARLLDPSRFEIGIAADPRFDHLFAAGSSTALCIQSISTTKFASAIDRGRRIYDRKTLDAYLADDLRVIASFAPDIVIGDFRLSLSVSARLARIPYINVANAGWSPYAELRFPIPALPIVRRVGLPIAQGVFDRLRPIAFRAHARSLDALRRHHGMPALGNLQAAYTDGDRVLYADVPELFRMRALPETHTFAGAVLWSPDVPRPPWWQALPTDRPIVYVTFGSSGASGLLDTLIAAFAALPLTVIVATAGRSTVRSTPANVHVADYLPGSDAARLASVVVCNGGSPTCYQALAAGVPVLGIPSNLDQFLNMSAVERSGAGVLVRPERVTEVAIREAVRSLLRSEAHRRCATGLQEAIARMEPAAALADTILRALDATGRASADAVG